MVLNVAEDHLDWHGAMAAYAAAKARVLDGRVAVGRADDPVAAGCWRGAAARGGSVSGSASPAAASWACVDGMLSTTRSAAPAWPLVRRHRSRSPVRPGCSMRWPPPRWPAPYGGGAAGRRATGWRASGWARTAPRWCESSTGSTIVDDSKATNPHAAQASIRRIPAGGVDRRRAAQGCVGRRAGRCGGGSAGRSGVDRPRPGRSSRDALARHAPDVPVVELVTGEDSGVRWDRSSSATRSMAAVVEAARGCAGPRRHRAAAPGRLRPSTCSRGYGQRGDAFAAAVSALTR